jgi:threonylcarbamoyladenosine tRNA methylthiotransferase MtaB
MPGARIAFGVNASMRRSGQRHHGVRETAGHLIDGHRRPRARLRAGAERLRPSLHLLHHPLWPRQFALGADGRGGRAGQALVGNGYAEVVLTGVDITSYGADLPGTPKLGKLVQQILRHVPDLRGCASPRSIRSRPTRLLDAIAARAG